ncbi:MAG: hypothetical protein A4E53_01134 [Pelotomaculum sp. PtaB.Bin104]|nr:MAG: hypothetical protein A4E53_01134 [Pelotomaculum sp. PtaB.Bin104]
MSTTTRNSIGTGKWEKRLYRTLYAEVIKVRQGRLSLKEGGASFLLPKIITNRRKNDEKDCDLRQRRHW